MVLLCVMETIKLCCVIVNNWIWWNNSTCLGSLFVGSDHTSTIQLSQLLFGLQKMKNYACHYSKFFCSLYFLLSPHLYPGSRDSLGHPWFYSAHCRIWATWQNVHIPLSTCCPISATKHAILPVVESTLAWCWTICQKRLPAELLFCASSFKISTRSSLARNCFAS